MNERKVILFSPSGETKTMGWTEAMSSLNLTQRELETIINYNGIIRGFYIDEVLE